MCFSAQASFTSAVVLAAIGALAIAKAKTNYMQYFAATPLIFGFQQALEGIVWVTINSNDTTSLIHKIGVYGFLAIAGMLWPTAIPWTLYKLEKNKTRKKILGYNLIIGISIALFCILNLTINGMKAQATHHHIAYLYAREINSSIAPYMYFVEFIIRILYCIATLGSLLISSVSGMWILGVIGTIAFIVAHIFYYMAFGSVWCFFAAIASIATYYVVSQNKK